MLSSKLRPIICDFLKSRISHRVLLCNTFQFNHKLTYTIQNSLQQTYSTKDHTNDSIGNPNTTSTEIKSKLAYKNELALKEREILLQDNDPDVFGSLSAEKAHRINIIDDNEGEDPDDAKEREYIENKPRRSQQLSTKQYATMIKNHFKNYQVKEAIDVLEVRMLKEDRVKPENYIYNLLVSELGRLGYVKKAFSLYNRMKQRDLKVTGATYTALFNGCAQTPFVEDGLKRAQRLREIMLEKSYDPNASNYHAMMKAFGRCGDLTTVFELMDEMKDKKIRLEVQTFNFLLQAAASDKEFGFRHALLVWHKLYRHGMKPDIFTFNLMLRCVRDCGIGDLVTMQKTIGEILHSTKKSLPAKENLLKLEKGDSGEMILLDKKKDDNPNNETTALALKEQDKDQLPNLLSKTPHLGNLVALGEIKKPEDRLMLIGGVNGLLEEMESMKTLANIKTFTQLLDSIPHTYEAEKELLQKMRSIGVRVDVDFFNMLMKRRNIRLDYDGARVK